MPDTAAKMRGTHDNCNNDKPHLSPIDCWEQPDMYESEHLCKMCGENPAIYLLCDDCVFREMTQEEEL